MADISQIKLPNNTTYDLKDSKKTGIYYVKGTQTDTTGSWTGNIDVPALYTGLTIMYYLPYDGSGNATLNLTLSNGTTTGAKNCYISTGRLTTHYGAGRNIIMTFYKAGDISIKGTATTDDRWICDAFYDQNDITTLRAPYSRPIANSNGVKKYSLYAFTDTGEVSSFTTDSGTGTKTFNTTDYFDIRKIFYNPNNVDYTSAAIGHNNVVTEAISRFDCRYSFNGVTTSESTSSLEANKPLYLVFNKSNTSAVSLQLKSPYFTQTPDDTNAVYVLVGYMADSYRCDLFVNNYSYRYGGPDLFYPYSRADWSTDSKYVNGHTVGVNVPSDAVFTDTNNRRGYYGTCSTAAATAAKTVTLSNTDGWELVAGVIVGVKFSNTNSAENVTLDINGTGNKSIYYSTSVYAGKASQICGTKNGITYYMYDGTNWVFINYSGNYTDSNTHRPINVDGTQTLGNNTTALNLKSGTNVTLTASSGDVTISSGKWTSASTGAVGDTTITISDSSITANSVIDVYTSNSSGTYIGLNTLVASTGSATITFDELEESTQFKLLIR